MSEATNRTAIYDKISTVADIGVVHKRRRWAADWKKFIEYFVTEIGGNTMVRGWQISLKSSTENYTSVKPRTYRIEGFHIVNDSLESELLFVALVEAIAAAFRSDRDLGEACLKHDFIQVVVMDERSFGGTLCHYCELNVTLHDHNP